jgi:hypothetical protein
MQSPKAAVREKRTRRPTLTQSAEKFADVEEVKREIDKSSLERSSSSSDEEKVLEQGEDSDFEVSEIKKTELSDAVKQAIVNLTNNFSLTYVQIK